MSYGDKIWHAGLTSIEDLSDKRISEDLTLKSRTEKNVNTSFSKLSGSNELKVSDQLRLIVVHNKF